MARMVADQGLAYALIGPQEKATTFCDKDKKATPHRAKAARSAEKCAYAIRVQIKI